MSFLFLLQFSSAFLSQGLGKEQEKAAIQLASRGHLKDLSNKISTFQGRLLYNGIVACSLL
jgi:hypothetical protein